jgi:hypothetical protein
MINQDKEKSKPNPKPAHEPSPNKQVPFRRDNPEPKREKANSPEPNRGGGRPPSKTN